MAAFRRALPDLARTHGLVRAATAIANHADASADADAVLAQLVALAGRIRGRAPGGSSSGLLAHAHVVLFEEEGFGGNRQRYYDPENSYLPWVLLHRKGIPITLVLVYKAVLESLGLGVEGIGAPGHFLAQVQVEGRPALVDPFHGGILLTQGEAHTRVEQVLGRQVQRSPGLLAPVDHAAWVRRMLRNLQEAYRRAGGSRDRHAMLELELALDQHLRRG